jgi:regulator of replication initiation timing
MNKFGIQYRTFDDYFYRRGGELFLLQQFLYRSVWRSFENSPNVLVSQFEDLKKKFNHTVTEILNVANINDVNLEKLRENISIPNLRKKYNDQDGAFFRKGDIGEHRVVIKNGQIYEDILNLEKLNYNQLKVAYHRALIKYGLKNFTKLPGVIYRKIFNY